MWEQEEIRKILTSADNTWRKTATITALVAAILSALAFTSHAVYELTFPINVVEQRLIRGLSCEIARLKGSDVELELAEVAYVANRLNFRDIRDADLGLVMGYLNARLTALEAERRKLPAPRNDW